MKVLNKGVVSLIAGLFAGSVSLIGFGFDSLIEVTSGAAVLWRLRCDHHIAHRETAERRTLQTVGWCFIALSIYILYDAETVTAGTWMPSVRGVKAIRERYQKLFAQPGFELSLKTHRLLATESGTIAYTTGIWNMPESAGPYFFLWRKQQDGKYKILIDSAWRARTPE